MRENLTEMVFVLDRSGSMSGLAADTIGGFNELIEKQKKIEGCAYVTTVLFDHEYEVLLDHVALEEVAPLTDKEYFARGSTALLDAVGRTIDAVGARLAATAEEERPEHVVFVITTDGMENSSREYTAQRVRGMIEHQQQKYSWQFVFLGANMDAVSEARNGLRMEVFSGNRRKVTRLYEQHSVLDAAHVGCGGFDPRHGCSEGGGGQRVCIAMRLPRSESMIS